VYIQYSHIMDDNIYDYDYNLIVFRNMLAQYFYEVDDSDFYYDSCMHYKSRCNIIAPCCNEVFPCRRCHNLRKDHKLKAGDIQQIVCRSCLTKQPVSNYCITVGCEMTFGEYYCYKCRIYDIDDGMKYHCDKCNSCLPGSTGSWFHCDTCNCCLDINLKNNHNCKRDTVTDNCAICLDDLVNGSLKIIRCGHVFHNECLMSLLDNDNKCPICRRLIVL
jgi:RING finger and CHY zinc finger domain-containing protein 1